MNNWYRQEIPAEVVPYLEEYLNVWRLRLPYAKTDRHLLLSRQGSAGGMLHPGTLRNKLLLHVYRLTGKRLSPHTLRTLFVSHAITGGLDVNSVAYVMNDTPRTVMLYYNEMYGEQEQVKAHDFYRWALNGGPLPLLTPPVIPDTPKAPPPPKVDDEQMALL
jgi:site-specific recombinase XerD